MVNHSCIGTVKARNSYVAFRNRDYAMGVSDEDRRSCM